MERSQKRTLRVEFITYPNWIDLLISISFIARHKNFLKMAQSTYSNHEVQVEAVFADTNNVFLCSRVQLRDYPGRQNHVESEYYENYQNEDYQNEFSFDIDNCIKKYDDPEMLCEVEENQEELELMKSLGLPTSFGRKPRHKESRNWEDDEYYSSEQNYSYEYSKYYGNEKNYFNKETNYINQDCDQHYTAMNDEWLSYWERNGESIILDSWIRKYKDYINPDYLRENYPTIHFNNKDTKIENQSACELNNIKDKLEIMNFVDQIMEIDDEDGKSYKKNGSKEMNVYDTPENSSNTIDCDFEFSSTRGKCEHTHCDPAFVKEVKEFSEKNLTNDYDELINNTPPVKEYNNMFSVTANLEDTEEFIPSTKIDWDDLWLQHKQEQYDHHFKSFSSSFKDSSNLNSSSDEKNNSDLFDSKCEACGRQNCCFCIPKVDDTALIEELGLTLDGIRRDTIGLTSNLEQSYTAVENILTSEIFADDHTENSVFSSGESLEESHKMEGSINELLSEIPKKSKRHYSSESEEDLAAPDKCIKDLGFVIKPEKSLQ
ncbi:uncharacterized protein CEXT_157041 [Caerostris extrusa]|uniref:Uncharacterized protein n=1 Tax=Caerostris extrusa TaxID=172846 RepID=A0AAV4NZ32_CAEEX|nr:uncharacterized protein CEXT_157041 [Caerostris extrusa]